jgi:phosphatidate cytidylyltransferase
MLRWRLLLGTLIIGALVGLGWLDHRAALPGIWLMPVAAIFTMTATAEMLHLLALGTGRPVPWVVYSGNLLLLAANWVPWVCCRGGQSPPSVSPAVWPMLALAAGMMLVFAAEMCRYQKPGSALANTAAAAFVLVYVGAMLGLMVQLRMVWGLAGLASLVIVVKMADTGAYTVGRLMGRHTMAPILSPRKTVEGAIGGLLAACLACWPIFVWLIPLATSANPHPGALWRAIVFGLVVGGAGMLGDLAESLIKRDVGSKDSSRWLPGFGGVLDLLDSLLLAAPAAWLCWILGLFG